MKPEHSLITTKHGKGYITKYRDTKTTAMMETINDILYLCGLPHLWVAPVTFSDKFTKIFDVVSTICHCFSLVFTALLLAAFVTQNNLTDKQKADRFVVNLANPLTHFYDLVFLYHKDKVRNVLYTLMVELKEKHNDAVEEKTLIYKYKMYMLAYLVSSLLTWIFFSLFGLYEVSTGLPFVTVITAWPDVEDVTIPASIARVLLYSYWIIHFFRISGAYMILLALLIGLSQQYKNLQSYFYSLNGIFNENLEQDAMEKKFEESFVRGIQMHIKTIWCLNESKRVCRLVFDGQTLLATIAFVSLLPVLMSPERDLRSALANLPMAVLVLILTAYFMWNAGDISVEASFLPDAMYGSGWEHCRHASSVRVRKLVVIAMTQAQQPVIIKSLGFFELSYNNYLGIIKTSHSIFSVFY